jgi:hypothetical protein
VSSVEQNRGLGRAFGKSTSVIHRQSADRVTSTRLGSSRQLDVWFSNLLLFRTDMQGAVPLLHPRASPRFVVPVGDHSYQDRMERLWPANHSSWQIRYFGARVPGG